MCLHVGQTSLSDARRGRDYGLLIERVRTEYFATMGGYLTGR